MNYLKNLRETQGLSQADIASQLGYTTSQFVSNWERGLSFPPIKDIKRLALFYKVDAEYLFTLVKDAMLARYAAQINNKYRKSRAR